LAGREKKRKKTVVEVQDPPNSFFFCFSFFFLGIEPTTFPYKAGPYARRAKKRLAPGAKKSRF
jgi:hypothetical protein